MTATYKASTAQMEPSPPAVATVDPIAKMKKAPVITEKIAQPRNPFDAKYRAKTKLAAMSAKNPI